MATLTRLHIWTTRPSPAVAAAVASVCLAAASCTGEAPTTGQPGRAMVAGTGKSAYFVSDAAGKGLTNAPTNQPVELVPGTYSLSLNGSIQSVTVRAGETATVDAGSAMVAGTGKTAYFVSDASGKSLTNAPTNEPVELFPGNYVLVLDGNKQSIQVRPGQSTVVRQK